MPRFPKEGAQYRGVGNYLGKQRRTLNLTNRGWDMAHEMSLDLGVSHSAVYDLAVREMWTRFHGHVPPITYLSGRKPE